MKNMNYARLVVDLRKFRHFCIRASKCVHFRGVSGCGDRAGGASGAGGLGATPTLCFKNGAF